MTQTKKMTKIQGQLVTASPTPPPELVNYVANAYNAKDGNFLSKPVFALTYNNGHTIPWGSPGVTKDIPDQISAGIATNFYNITNSLLLEEKSDYDRSFSASVNAEYSGVTYSGSVQSSLLYHGSLFSSTSSFYALNFYLQSILTFERLDTTLDADFAAALKSLPEDISSPDNQQKYFDFFDSYGTHYTTSGTMGGTIIMETDIQQSLLETASELEITAAVSVGYEAIVSSGSLDVSTAYKNSEFLSQNQNSISISLSVLGGLYAPGEPIINWVNSIYNTPSLLLSVPSLSTQMTSLQSISDLVAIAGASAQIAANINSLVHNYVMLATLDDGSLLSSPGPIDFDTVYNTSSEGIVAGDGFVICSIEAAAEGDRGYVYAFDDTDSDPTTVIATASQHYYTEHDRWISGASSTMPTPNGTYFTIHETPTGGTPNTSLQFIGLGNVGEEGMGSWQKIDLNTDLTAPADGFISAYVDWNGSDGARGYVQGIQNNVVVAAASQHYYSESDIVVPTNSFCMPICQGTPYSVAFIATGESPAAQAFFVPLSEAYVFFQRFQSRTENRVYQALTDGFLVAYLS
ncbi:MAG TPA: MAC/perforin domain-containing protein, partial [Pyrinomonadaceae bacterium]